MGVKDKFTQEIKELLDRTQPIKSLDNLEEVCSSKGWYVCSILNGFGFGRIIRFYEVCGCQRQSAYCTTLVKVDYSKRIVYSSFEYSLINYHYVDFFNICDYQVDSEDFRFVKLSHTQTKMLRAMIRNKEVEVLK